MSSFVGEKRLADDESARSSPSGSTDALSPPCDLELSALKEMEPEDVAGLFSQEDLVGFMQTIDPDDVVVKLPEACFCQPPGNEPTKWLQPVSGRFLCSNCNAYVVRVGDMSNLAPRPQLAAVTCVGARPRKKNRLNDIAMRFQCADRQHDGGGADHGADADPFATLHYTKKMPGNQADDQLHKKRLRMWCEQKNSCVGAAQGCAYFRNCDHGSRPGKCATCIEQGLVRKSAKRAQQPVGVPQSLGAPSVEAAEGLYRSLGAAAEGHYRSLAAGNDEDDFGPVVSTPPQADVVDALALEVEALEVDEDALADMRRAQLAQLVQHVLAR